MVNAKYLLSLLSTIIIIVLMWLVPVDWWVWPLLLLGQYMHLNATVTVLRYTLHYVTSTLGTFAWLVTFLNKKTKTNRSSSEVINCSCTNFPHTQVKYNSSWMYFQRFSNHFIGTIIINWQEAICQCFKYTQINEQHLTHHFIKTVRLIRFNINNPSGNSE